MKNWIIAGLLFLSLVTATECAEASEWRAKVREAKQSGAITKEEAKILRAEFKKLKVMRASARHDGKVSQDERKQLKETRDSIQKKAQELIENDQRRVSKNQPKDASQ